jgi:hypothetical protein
VLLDGPDFQMLGPAARWVFVAMKINLGPCGIEVEYPDALVARLASQTGHDIPTIIAALDELERDGWIQREANVVWVVGQLEHDPALKASNPKHVASVRDHIKGLPRIGIIGLFLDKYRRWFDMESDPKWFDNLRQKYPKGIEKAVQWLSDAYRMPMDSPSDQKSDTRDTTEDRRPNSETEKLSDSNESDAGAVRKKLYTDRAALMGVVREVCYAPDGKPREPRGMRRTPTSSPAGSGRVAAPRRSNGRSGGASGDRRQRDRLRPPEAEVRPQDPEPHAQRRAARLGDRVGRLRPGRRA